jgi:hypothetical protein
MKHTILALAAATTLSSFASAADDAPSFEGIPTPATRAATGAPTIGKLSLGAEIFATYTQRVSGDGNGTGDSRFELGRLHLATQYATEHMTARVVIEGVRATADGALFGVAGDSFVMRAREAYAEAHLPFDVHARAGIVPTLTVPEIEGTWLVRSVSPVPLEASRMAFAADAGAQLKWNAPARFGWVAASVTNGEGYASRELDDRKNLEVAASIHPLASLKIPALTLFASATRGTLGVTSARNDRATGALLWKGVQLRAGLSYTAGYGLNGDGAMRPTLVEAFVSSEPLPAVLLGFRANRFVIDSRGDSPTVDGLLASVGYRLAAELEVHGVFDMGRANDAAKVAQPGADRTEGRIVVRALF